MGDKKMNPQNEISQSLISELETGDMDFYKQVADLLTMARKYAKKQMDSTIARTYFEVGRMIVEREQQGQNALNTARL